MENYFNLFLIVGLVLVVMAFNYFTSASRDVRFKQDPGPFEVEVWSKGKSLKRFPAGNLDALSCALKNIYDGECGTITAASEHSDSEYRVFFSATGKGGAKLMVTDIKPTNKNRARTMSKQYQHQPA